MQLKPLQLWPLGVLQSGSCLSSSEYSLPFCCRLSSWFPGPSPRTAVSSEPGFLMPENGIQGKKMWGPAPGLRGLGKAPPASSPGDALRLSEFPRHAPDSGPSPPLPYLALVPHEETELEDSASVQFFSSSAFFCPVETDSHRFLGGLLQPACFRGPAS